VLHAVGLTMVADKQKDPAGQSTHTVDDAAEYWPVEHATGAEFVFAQNDPAGQLVQVEEPVKEYWPAEQAVATLKPATLHRLPAGHAAQVE
jgi:hypothetical protein